MPTPPAVPPPISSVARADDDPAVMVAPAIARSLTAMSCIQFRREMDLDGTIRYPWVSDAAKKILGEVGETLSVTSRGALNIVHWADRNSHLDSIQDSARLGMRSVESFRAVSSMGETHWFQGTAMPCRLPDGTIRWDGIWIDVTPSRRAEYRFQTVMDHAEDCILTIDSQSAIDWANGAAMRLFGWKPWELLGRGLGDLLTVEPDGLEPEDNEENSLSMWHGAREMTGRRRDGTTFPFEMTISEVRNDGQLSLIVIGRDITRRKATEARLEETERRLSSIASNLPGVVFQRVREAEGQYSYPYLSEGIADILGQPAEAIMQDPHLLFAAIPDSDRLRLINDLEQSVKTLSPVGESTRIVGTDGRQHWLSGESRPRRRDGVIVWDGLLLDVTTEVEERNKAERAIRDSEERFRMAFAAASIGIIVSGQDGIIHQLNPAFERMCGIKSGSLLGENLFRFVEREHIPLLDELVVGGAVCFDYQPRLPDHRDRHWRVTCSPFAAGDADCDTSLLFLVDDVTDTIRAIEERRQLELALTEGQKLEALGRLAGGVAHELNNMLGPIMMAAEMLARTSDLDEKGRERCARIIDAAKHGRDIVHNVLAYCRKEQKTLTPMDLVETFRQFCLLATSTLPPTVKTDIRITLDSAVVIGNPGQMTQILLNMVNNARDAMEGRGTLTLALGPAHLSTLRPRCQLRSRRSPPPAEQPRPQNNPFAELDLTRPHVEIIVNDSGCGMTDEVRAKIFDPFYTTKPVGQGTGLGLSVVQGIVKSMGGAIGVSSIVGQGTKFRIVLPLAPPLVVSDE